MGAVGCSGLCQVYMPCRLVLSRRCDNSVVVRLHASGNGLEQGEIITTDTRAVNLGRSCDSFFDGDASKCQALSVFWL